MSISLNADEKTLFKKLDWNFVVAILVLNFVGLINLYSATHGPHSETVETLFINQIIWLMIGWSCFFIVTFIDYQIVSKICWGAYILNVLALIYTATHGNIALGAQRWINFGFFKYQPSETMKIAIIILLAHVLTHRQTDHDGMGIRDLIKPLLIVFVPFAIIVKQPDLGTAMMIAAISGTMILFMKVKKWILFLLASIAIVAAPLAWNYALHDYQKNRILTFISPTIDPKGTGYNSIQSKIAVGSGMFLGKGFRKGTQSQLEFLPERHTDFIYSVLSEEHGFVGSILTLGLFCFLFLVGIRIASTARDKYGALLTVGILCYIFWHMFINIGMVIGLLPIVGVPLPLLSYGGSSMLTTMLGMGIVSSVAYRRFIF